MLEYHVAQKYADTVQSQVFGVSQFTGNDLGIVISPKGDGVTGIRGRIIDPFDLVKIHLIEHRMSPFSCMLDSIERRGFSAESVRISSQ
jgi:hypothetical protein